MPEQSLAEFELFVMLAVARLSEPYGAVIRKEIQDRTGRNVSIGALYATLSRLGEKGLLTFEQSAPRPVQGGRARKFCYLTPEGRDALELATTRLASMSEGLDLDAVKVETP